MKAPKKSRRKGFTLVEIMIVVAIIGLLAALAIPNFAKARKKSQAERVLNDCRMIDAAIDQGAFEMGLKDGDRAIFHNNCNYYFCTCMMAYLKRNCVGSASQSLPNDVLGNPYSFGVIGTNQVRINQLTKDALSSIAVDWGPY